MPRISGALDIAQVSDPATPVSGRQVLYFKSDGILYSRSSNGAVVQIGANVPGGKTVVLDGGATPNESYDGIVVTSGAAIFPTIVDVKGDLIAASGPDTVTRFPIGAVTGQVLTVDPVSSVGMSWATPVSNYVSSAKWGTE